jgi:hypothetical protein
MTALSAVRTCGRRELDSRRVQGYVLEIIISAAVPLIDEHHFKWLIRRGITEYSREKKRFQSDFPDILTRQFYLSWYMALAWFNFVNKLSIERDRSRPAGPTAQIRAADINFMACPVPIHWLRTADLQFTDRFLKKPIKFVTRNPLGNTRKHVALFTFAVYLIRKIFTWWWIRSRI